VTNGDARGLIADNMLPISDDGAITRGESMGAAKASSDSQLGSTIAGAKCRVPLLFSACAALCFIETGAHLPNSCKPDSE
jgi:hypothetical protein